MRDGRLLNTLERRGDEYRYYYSFGSDRHHACFCCHPYRRNDSVYLPDEFKKSKPPTFDGDVMKKAQEKDRNDRLTP